MCFQRDPITISSSSLDELPRHALGPVTREPSQGGFNSVWLHRLVGTSRAFRGVSLGLQARVETALLAMHKDGGTLAAIREAKRGRESLLGGNELFTVFSVAQAQSALDGEMAEVGVYQGCSAKIISTASQSVPLHLFDTFAGLPPPGAHEHARLREGQYAAGLPRVRDFLATCANVSFYPGLFPGSGAAVSARRFSFVHLDVDLESSTQACLEFFYDRMVPGGVILTHDYSYLQGVRTAFTKFLSTRPERPIELATSQAILVKR